MIMDMRSVRLLLGVLMMAGTSGCLLPEYHLPQGFSSSYHRYLFAKQPTVNEVPAPLFESSPDGPILPRQPPVPPTEPGS
jgi:hypothetical protein